MQANNYQVKATDGAEGVQVFVVVGKVALEVRVLLVEHLLHGCQLNWQRAHLSTPCSLRGKADASSDFITRARSIKIKIKSKGLSQQNEIASWQPLSLATLSIVIG